jgi:short-chain fatty acids transporter
MRPSAKEMQVFVPPAESIAPVPDGTARRALFARRIERSAVGSLFLAVAGVAYVAVAWMSGQLTVDINLVIFLFLIAGLALHGSPVNYGDAVKNAARQTGSMMLQYPIYGGIMGIMTRPGWLRSYRPPLPLGISGTLPVLNFHRRSSSRSSYRAAAGTGPCRAFHHSRRGRAQCLDPATTMAVAMGQVVTHLQPFWALPVVAIAGVASSADGVYVLTFVVTPARLRRRIVAAGLRRP